MCEPNKWIMIKPKQIDRQTIKNYSWSKKRKRNPTKCGCIIFNDSLDEIVLVENNYMYNEGIQKWGLPKGHLENDESYSICASREANEETGLSLTILDSMYRIRINILIISLLKLTELCKISIFYLEICWKLEALNGFH